MWNMSKNNLIFNSRLNASVAPKLIKDTNHSSFDLKVRSLEAKVYFMSNCDNSYDLNSTKFINYINENDPYTLGCMDEIVLNPQVISENCTNIKMNNKTEKKLKNILSKYMSLEMFEEFRDSIRETPIISNTNLPLTHKGKFRVMSIYNYDDIDGNVLYVVFYDPYHLVFSSDEKNYNRQKGTLGENIVSIREKYHSKIDVFLIKEFESLNL